MAVDFCDYFWGEKNEGFNVLYQNMKCGVIAAKELTDFFRERAKLEEDNAKVHAKLAKQLGNGQACGTFGPLLLALKVSAEKLALVHNQWTVKLNGLAKDVAKYNDDLHRKHKTVKDEMSPTLETVKAVQETTSLLTKAKENFKQRALELEKLKRDGASQKEIEKSETKFRRAQEEYKALVDKYSVVRDEFEKRMVSASKQFQDVETSHLNQLRQFIETYCQIVDHNMNQLGRVHQDYRIQMTDLTIENLLEQFTLAKHTGLEKPGPVEFDEEKISLASLNGPPSDISAGSAPGADAISVGGASSSFLSKETGSTGSPVAASTTSPTQTPAASTSMTTSNSTAGSFIRNKNWSRSAANISYGGGLGSTKSLVMRRSALQKEKSVTSLCNFGTKEVGGGSLKEQGSKTKISTSSANMSTVDGAIASKVSSRATSLLNLFVPSSAMSSRGSVSMPFGQKIPSDTSLKSRVDQSQEFMEDIGRTPVDDNNNSLNVTDTVKVEEETESLSYANQLGDSPTTVLTEDGKLSSSLSFTASPSNASGSGIGHEDPSPSRSPYPNIGNWTVSGFLRRNRKKDKKKKNNDSTLSESMDVTSKEGVGSDGEDMRKSETPTPDVDEEGYSKQPSSGTDPWADFNKKESNFYSSSDESDDESTKRKIKVEIKPVTNGGDKISASVDELRNAVGAIELLNPPPSVSRENKPLTEMIDGSKNNEIRRTHSQSNLSRPLPSHDLLGLTLHPIDPIDPPSNNGDKDGAKDMDQDTSTMSSTSKEVQDIFGTTSTGDFNQTQQPSLPPKQRPSSVQREKISNSLIALPRPPSRLQGGSGNNARASPIHRKPSLPERDVASKTPPPLLPAKSSVESSPTYQNRVGHVGMSRGPSPLTIGMSEVVPLAVAFQEVCHTCFRGAEESQVQVRLIGDLMVSFPAGIVNVVANNAKPQPLQFRIKNPQAMESVVPNKQLISVVASASKDSSRVFEFDMKALKELLKQQYEQSPSASYFNIDILKYQVKSKPGAGSCPLQMVAYWKCEDNHTDLRLDYKYNSHSMAIPCPLLNLSLAVPIDGGVQNMQSQPTGTWLKESNRALWKFPELSQHNNGGIGSLRGRFQLSSGPGSQGTIAAQFNCEGTTLSGVDFELVGPGYRLSLVKKRFVSGKYICDGNASASNPTQYRYAAPPGGGSEC